LFHYFDLQLVLCEDRLSYLAWMFRTALLNNADDMHVERGVSRFGKR